MTIGNDRKAGELEQFFVSGFPVKVNCLTERKVEIFPSGGPVTISRPSAALANRNRYF